MPFSENTLQHLRKAGWSEERRIDLSAQIAVCQAKNIAVYPVVVAFMERYGDLHIRFPWPYYDIETHGLHDVLILEVQYLERELEEGYNTWCCESIGRPLCKIGYYDSYHCEMFMDSDGRVYGHTDDYLWCIASSGEEAIEAIVNGLPPIQRYDTFEEEMKEVYEAIKQRQLSPETEQEPTLSKTLIQRIKRFFTR